MNNTSIAFISGKGGSGKTTLALSIASLLGDCGINVLLIDCDLSTNGATYFYERRIEKSKKAVSFLNLLHSDEPLTSQEIMRVSDMYSFLPSVTSIAEEENAQIYFSSEDAARFHRQIRNLKTEYDVILFDCQAGYRGILNEILGETDETLLVMEADAVSSSAARALFLKIGNAMGRNKSYQVFNKVTNEEKDIFSKVSGGTLFDTLGCIGFDWTVRKAFSVLQVPDMKNTSVEYGMQLYNVLCKSIFPDDDLREKLRQFDLAVKIKEREEQMSVLLKKRREAIEERERLSEDANNRTELVHKAKEDIKKTSRYKTMRSCCVFLFYVSITLLLCAITYTNLLDIFLLIGAEQRKSVWFGLILIILSIISLWYGMILLIRMKKMYAQDSKMSKEYYHGMIRLMEINIDEISDDLRKQEKELAELEEKQRKLRERLSPTEPSTDITPPTSA